MTVLAEGRVRTSTQYEPPPTEAIAAELYYAKRERNRSTRRAQPGCRGALSVGGDGSPQEFERVAVLESKRLNHTQDAFHEAAAGRALATE
jgi:hypothetical protein